MAKAGKADQVQVPDDRCFTGFDGYRRVIEASDVVCIANAAKFHPFHAMAAIQAGKHVFVEKPHGIDPRGDQTDAGGLRSGPAEKLEPRVGPAQPLPSRLQETVQRIQDGAIGDVVAIEENFLRAPYGVTDRAPGLTELQWQCSTQYHFRWLSGDDVPQSLVHNMDRASWVLGNKAPRQMPRVGRAFLDGRAGLR